MLSGPHHHHPAKATPPSSLRSLRRLLEPVQSGRVFTSFIFFYFSLLTLLVPALFLLTLLPCRTSSSSSCTSRTRALRHCFALPRKRQIKQGCGGETPPPSLPLPFLFISFFGGWNLLPPHVGKHEMRSVYGGLCGVKRSENLIFIHAGRGVFKTMRPEEPPPSTPPSTHPEKQQLGR